MVFGWTQNDGAMNVGPAHLIEKEADMIAPLRQFAHALTENDIMKLFSLYDADDFEEDITNYEATKDTGEPSISVHYFRTSRTMRDLLFACSSIDFGFHMSRHSKKENRTFPGVRLYDLNQSMLTPLWKGAGMSHIGVSHGSDANYLFNGLFPERDVSEADQDLSKQFFESFINFAYTGIPTAGANGDNDREGWPEAFTDLDQIEPAQLNLVVVGGP
jgi:carboxylesterase type B